MLQLGAVASQTREMKLDDVFLLRLKLLLYMAGDCLNARNFSHLRRQVMLENALHIEIESMALGYPDKQDRPRLDAESDFNFDRLLFYCTKELCTIIKSVARGVIMDERQKKALQKKTAEIVCILGTANDRHLRPSSSKFRQTRLLRPEQS